AAIARPAPAAANRVAAAVAVTSVRRRRRATTSPSRTTTYRSDPGTRARRRPRRQAPTAIPCRALRGPEAFPAPAGRFRFIQETPRPPYGDCCSSVPNYHGSHPDLSGAAMNDLPAFFLRLSLALILADRGLD